MTTATRSLRLVSLAFLLPITPAFGLQGWTTESGETIEVPTGKAMLVGSNNIGMLIELMLTEQVAENGPAFSIAVMQGGELLYATARGLADLERQVPADEETVFNVASVSKSVTATAIAMLVEAGDIELDASVRGYIPELSSVYEPVRIRHLVHHTGGVEDSEGMLALAGWRTSDPGSFEDAVRILGGLQHLRFEPGTTHMYSNGGRQNREQRQGAEEHSSSGGHTQTLRHDARPRWRRAAFVNLLLTPSNRKEALPSQIAGRGTQVFL